MNEEVRSQEIVAMLKCHLSRSPFKLECAPKEHQNALKRRPLFTSDPSLLQTDPISSPITPPPITIIYKGQNKEEEEEE